MRVVTAKDLRQPVRTRPNEPVIVRLEENPSTGYRWQLIDVPGDTLRPDATEFKSSSDALGGGGFREFTFCPRKPGRYLVVLRNSFAATPTDSDPEERLDMHVD